MKHVEDQQNKQPVRAALSAERKSSATNQTTQQLNRKEQPSAAASKVMHAINKAVSEQSAKTTEEVCKYTGLKYEDIKSAFLEYGGTEEQIKQLEPINIAQHDDQDGMKLDEREQYILSLLVMRVPYSHISIMLGIKTAVIEEYRQSIFNKIEFNSIDEVSDFYEKVNNTEKSELTIRELKMLKNLRSSITNKNFPNGTTNLRALFKNKSPTPPKATLPVDTPHIINDFASSGGNVENILTSLYSDTLRIIKEITDEIAGWDKEALDLLAQKVANGALKRWLDDQASHANRLSDITQHSNKAVIDNPDHLQPPGGELYAARPNRKETAPAFIERVYGGAGWLTGEFTRADLRKVDPGAAAALNNFESHRGHKLTLKELNLPTVKERYDRLLASGELSETLRAGERVRGAIRRRLKNG